jgi:ATP-dependent Clp protease ATP-binding subunit ClpA
MPRGIVGSERGGVLTNQLRDQPYSVVLLDEVEKASPSLLNLFLQAFDEGWLTDGRGKRVYLSDAIVIMTSNLGSEHFRRLTSPLGFGTARSDVGQVEGDVMRELERRFPPEFRNRIDEVVLFAPLTKDEVREIAGLHLGRMTETLRAKGRLLNVDSDALERIVERGHSLAYGARFLKRAIDDLVKLPISERWQNGHTFNVRLDGDDVVVEAVGPRLVAERPEQLAYGT